MHVQIKSSSGPPEGVGGKVDGWVIHDEFRAKPLDARGKEWLFEPIATRATEARVMPVPEWLAMSDYRLFVHDTEIRNGSEATVLCSTEGRPLIPYYIPIHQQPGIPSAFFSLAFPYIRIVFNGAIHHALIEKVEPKLQEIEGTQYATADVETIFEGPMSVTSAYCRTCKAEFPLDKLSLHSKHVILPSRFSGGPEINRIDKALRAAYKKSRATKSSRVYYVASRTTDNGSEE